MEFIPLNPSILEIKRPVPLRCQRGVTHGLRFILPRAAVNLSILGSGESSTHSPLTIARARLSNFYSDKVRSD